jgi:NAD(P)-dependent dehydrogenase (short-subunit alcohol dehydrogenase family)
MAPNVKPLRDLVTRPIGAAGNLLNRPVGAAGRHRPFYPLNLVDRLRGGHSLEEAVRDRVVMVTGASSGIGEAAALQIGAAGATVVLVARGLEKLEATAAAVEHAGGTAHVHPCDLSDMDAIDRMAAEVLEAHGRVDVLVNNAGRSIRRSLALSYERFHDYERTMQLNYFAPLRLILRLVPGMRERRFGQVVNISSVGVQTRVPRFGAYIASKAALDTLCDALQAEVHREGVRFTTVHMPLVRTPMIAPTRIYDRFPALTPEQAGAVVCDAITYRPRRISPPVGHAAAFADAVSPQLMDAVRNRGFSMFPDSKAARETAGAPPAEEVSAGGRAFAQLTRGVHW